MYPKILWENPMKLNFNNARAFLNRCTRDELRDHAFGDAEIAFYLDGVEVAGGFIGSSSPTHSVWATEDSGHEFESFTQEQVRELLKCGIRGTVERNDETGPDTFREGVCMPGLTLEGVRKELTNPEGRE